MKRQKSKKTYFIKEGYKSRLNPKFYQNTVEAALVYQIDVYRYAAAWMQKSQAGAVLDIGCGLGLKLEKFILPISRNITGVDLPETIKLCQQNNAFGHWFTDDIENPTEDLGGPFDLIICADVIEHLVDPDTLFSYMRKWSGKGTHLLISTPERDLRRGIEDMGPPGNKAHVREWNKEEFAKYIVSHGLVIHDHQMVELKEGMKTSQLILCSWENPPEES